MLGFFYDVTLLRNSALYFNFDEGGKLRIVGISRLAIKDEGKQIFQSLTQIETYF